MIPIPKKHNIVYLNVLISDRHLCEMAVRVLTQTYQNP